MYIAFRETAKMYNGLLMKERNGVSDNVGVMSAMTEYLRYASDNVKQLDANELRAKAMDVAKRLFPGERPSATFGAIYEPVLSLCSKAREVEMVQKEVRKRARGEESAYGPYW
jgi:hypothetical protein